MKDLQDPEDPRQPMNGACHEQDAVMRNLIIPIDFFLVRGATTFVVVIIIYPFTKISLHLMEPERKESCGPYHHSRMNRL